MSLTTKSISVSELKARLSEQLRRVKAGETVLITERGRPIAMMTPLPQEDLEDDLADLVEAGLVSLGGGPANPEFLSEQRPADPQGSVRQTILDERREGR